MILEMTLPWPPSINHYKTIGRTIKTNNGKMYQQRINSEKTKKFYYDVYMLYKQMMPLEVTKFASSATIYLDLRIYLYPPNSLRYDLDNRLKVLLDALVRAHVIFDDSNITRLYVEKCDMIKHGQAIVKIQESV